MPSGLRRTTRVFGLVKGVDGARVLRSGRRLWPESGEGKLRRSNDGDEWFHSMMKKSSHNANHGNNSAVKCKEKEEWAHDSKWQQNKGDMSIKVSKRVARRGKNRTSGRNKMFGVVYSRKRKRIGEQKVDTLEEDKRFVIQFCRRMRKKKDEGDVDNVVQNTPSELIAVVECGHSDNRFACLLSLVLRYIKRLNLRVSELAAFLVSEPVYGIFAMNGIRFLQDPIVDRVGICKFFASKHFVPMFSVDFSAIPLCFMYMHLSLVFRFKSLSPEPVHNPLDRDECDEMGDSEVDDLCVPMKTVITETKTIVAVAASSGTMGASHPSVRATKLAGRNTQYKNGLNSRGIQKRRSSLRRRKPRNPSLVGMHKANGALVCDLITSRKYGIPFSSVEPKNKLGRSLQNGTAPNIKDVSSTMVEVAQDSHVTSCSANILVIEPDKCCRIKGATIKLEISDSREWVLAVWKDGSTRYTHLAQKIMKPCSSNRITHDIIWTVNESWKLEFPSRQDWLIFKDLHKECYERNVPGSVSKATPVPGVHKVLGYEDSDNIPFTRPYTYISVVKDEVARALAKRTANYDMDSEDEEWLKKYNEEFLAETEQLSDNKFELMIDAFEKAFYCSPDYFSDEKAGSNLCLGLGQVQVVESVYGYWMKKKQQKRTPLLRVFQGHQAKKAPLIPKPALRKRRSFKRQSSQFGRGKQPSLLQALAAEQDALEEQNAKLKVEEAEISAMRSVESASLKRCRAQQLMENADLATYRAAVALRITEAALADCSIDVAATHFLD